MVYIENEGAVFRGVSRGTPVEVFNRSTKKFEPYTGDIPKPVEWGNLVDEAEAAELMAGR